jgi:hypothetical protein
MNLRGYAIRSYSCLFGNMGNQCNNYYLLLGNQELENIEGIQDLQKWSSSGVSSRVFSRVLVELRWSSGRYLHKRAKQGPA